MQNYFSFISRLYKGFRRLYLFLHRNIHKLLIYSFLTRFFNKISIAISYKEYEEPEPLSFEEQAQLFLFPPTNCQQQANSHFSILPTRRFD